MRATLVAAIAALVLERLRIHRYGCCAARGEPFHGAGFEL